MLDKVESILARELQIGVTPNQTSSDCMATQRYPSSIAHDKEEDCKNLDELSHPKKRQMVGLLHSTPYEKQNTR